MQANPLPCDLDSEKCLLGTLLMPDMADQFGLVDYLTADDFSTEKHKRIWRAMLEIREAGHVPDLVTVAGKLGDKGQLDSVGGCAYLCELDGTMGRIRGAEQDAARIKDKSIARKATIALQKIQNHIATSNGDPEALVEAEKVIQSLNCEAAGSKHELKTGAELIQAEGSLEDFMKVDAASVPTPFSQLTYLLRGGLRPGDLAILAARPSWGKTSLAQQFAALAAKEEIGTVFFSLETKAKNLLLRAACQESKVDLGLVQSQECPGDIRRRFMAGMSKIANLPIFYDDNYNNSVAKMFNVLRQHKAKGYPLGFVIIDYLQLMVTSKGENRNIEISNITRGLKLMLNELGIPGLILSQLKRPASKDEEQGLDDLRDSGSIEQDADVVMMLGGKEEDKNSPDSRWPVGLRLKKQRNGPLGTVHLSFNASCTLFELGTACEENV